MYKFQSEAFRKKAIEATVRNEAMWRAHLRDFRQMVADGVPVDGPCRKAVAHIALARRERRFHQSYRGVF